MHGSLHELPEAVDLAILLVPAAAVSIVSGTAGRAGVRSAIVCSSGFAEAGAEGVELQRQVVETASRYDLPVLGPNCLGYLDLGRSIAATFTTALQLDELPPPGGIAFVSQSGAMGAAMVALAGSRGAPLGAFVSTGNEAVVSFADVVSHLAADPELSTLIGYVEGTSDGRRLIGALRELRRAGKGAVIMKVGTTEVGSRAAQSHTGALAGTSEAWEAALRRAGVVSASGPVELLDLATAIDLCPPAVGKRIGVLTMSGGAGVVLADQINRRGLELASFDDGLTAALAGLMPGYAAIENPVDYGGVYGDTDTIGRALELIAEAPGVDAVVMFVGPAPAIFDTIAGQIAAVAASNRKPVLAVWPGVPRRIRETLRTAGVPVYEDPNGAVDAAAAVVAAAQALPDDLPVPAALPIAGSGELSERETKALLEAAGLPVSRDRHATTAAEAAAAATEIPGPYAVKVEADGLLHKSDVGAVLLGVSRDALPAAFDRVTEAARAAGAMPRGALIASMVEPGVELLVGGRFDDQFGPLVLVGAGGVMSEVWKDVRVELAPVTPGQAREMLESLRIGPLLAGYRGDAPRDLDALAELVSRVSKLVGAAGSSLRELDLNPVVVHENGCTIVDAAAVLA
jgi:acyl-CoA synthetase (NDP forming)